MLRIDDRPALVLDCRQQLGECPLWDERSGRLVWVNIHAGEIWSWDPFAGEPATMVALDGRVGAIGLRGEGGLVLAMERGFALLTEPGADATPAAAITDMPATVRLNDGRIDPVGRFVCGGMDEAEPQRPIASLYALDGTGRLDRRLDGIHCTNSLCWSPDGRTMYFTDMPSRRIDAFDYDPEAGAVGDRRTFARLDGPGLADGSVVDAEGCLWNAQWGGGQLVRYTPDGRVDRTVELPVTNPTCPVFGGPDLDILFVTSAWFGLAGPVRAAEPAAGGLFAFRPGVRGLPEHRFQG